MTTATRPRPGTDDAGAAGPYQSYVYAYPHKTAYREQRAVCWNGYRRRPGERGPRDRTCLPRGSAASRCP
ncbi:hypothetical protein STENM223S_06008 [Streptomyces tendae]